jgi:hypothetical protein
VPARRDFTLISLCDFFTPEPKGDSIRRRNDPAVKETRVFFSTDNIIIRVMYNQFDHKKKGASVLPSKLNGSLAAFSGPLNWRATCIRSAEPSLLSLVG